MPIRRQLALLCVSLAAGMMIAGDVQAQNQDEERQERGERGRRGRGFGGRGGPGFGSGGPLLGLLRSPEVREEIKLTEEQSELVDILRDDLQDAEGRPEFPRNYRELSDEEQAKAREEMRKWGDQQAAKAEASLTAVLEEDQFKRLKEIRIQQQGVEALAEEDVAKELKLTEQQQQQVAAKLEENRRKFREQWSEIFRGGDREAARERMNTLREEGEANVLAVLTEEQKQAFANMKGEPFELRSAFGFGGRGRGFRGPGGPGGRRGGGDRPERPGRPE